MPKISDDARDHGYDRIPLLTSIERFRPACRCLVITEKQQSVSQTRQQPYDILIIRRMCETSGYMPTTICTPLELLWEVS